jgi:hypothetical protein
MRKISVLTLHLMFFVFCLLGNKIHSQTEYFPSKHAVPEGYIFSKFCPDLNQFSIVQLEVDDFGNIYVLGHVQTHHNSQVANFQAAELFSNLSNPHGIFIEQNNDNPQTEFTFLAKISPQSELLWINRVNFEMYEFYVHENKIYSFVKNFYGASFPPLPFQVSINNENYPVTQMTTDGLIVFENTSGAVQKVFPHGNIRKYYFFSDKLNATISAFNDHVVFDENEEVINGSFVTPFSVSTIKRNRKNNEHYILNGQNFYRVVVNQNNQLSQTLVMNISQVGTPGFGSINQIVEHDGFYYFFNTTTLGDYKELILKYDVAGNQLLQIRVWDVFASATEGIDVDSEGNIWLITKSSYLEIQNFDNISNTTYYTNNKQLDIAPSLIKFDGNTGEPLFSYKIGINTAGASDVVPVKNHLFINSAQNMIYTTIFSDKDFFLIPREDTYDYISSEIQCIDGITSADHLGIVWYDLSSMPILEINELENQNLFSVYPNPTSGCFSLEFEGFEERRFALLDVTGKQLEIIQAQSSPFYINHELKSGVYFIKDIQSGQNLKIIVNHE